MDLGLAERLQLPKHADWTRIYELLGFVEADSLQPTLPPASEERSFDEWVARIQTDLKNRRLVLFVGAGISRLSPAVAPLWDELRKMIGDALADCLPCYLAADVQRAIGEAPNGFSIRPELLLELMVSYLGKQAFAPLNVLSLGAPNHNHHCIAALAKTGRLQIILTPNFDTYLEQALETAGFVNLLSLADKEEVNELKRLLRSERVKQFYAVALPFEEKREGFLSPDETWSLLQESEETHNCLVIFKVHGTLSDPESVSLTLTQTSRPLRGKNRKCFEACIAGKSLLFVGYSGRDDDLFSVLREHVENGKTPNISIFWNRHADIGVRPASLIAECCARGGRAATFKCAAEDLFEALVGSSGVQRPKILMPRSPPANSRRPLTEWAKGLDSIALMIVVGNFLLHLSHFCLAARVFEHALHALTDSLRFKDALPVYFGVALSYRQFGRRTTAAKYFANCRFLYQTYEDHTNEDRSQIGLKSSEIVSIGRHALLERAILLGMRRAGYEDVSSALNEFLVELQNEWPVRQAFSHLRPRKSREELSCMGSKITPLQWEMDIYARAEPFAYRKKVENLIVQVQEVVARDDSVAHWKVFGLFCQTYGMFLERCWRGEHSTPAAWYEKALNAFEQAGDQVALAELLYACGLHHDGNVKTRQLWHRALEIKRELGDRQGCAEIILDHALQLPDNLDRLFLLRHCLLLFNDIEDPRGQIRTLMEIASSQCSESETSIACLLETLRQFDITAQERDGMLTEHDYNAKSSVLYALVAEYDSGKNAAKAIEYYQAYLNSRKGDTGIRNGFADMQEIRAAQHRLTELSPANANSSSELID